MGLASVKPAATLVSTSPGRNYEILGEVSISTLEDIKEAVDKARAAQQAWNALGVSGRVAAMRKLLDIMKRRAEEIAQLTAKEMGMPISGARGTNEWSFSHLEWDLQNAERVLAPQKINEDESAEHWLYRENFGVAGVITPWNFPLSNFTDGAHQSLLAGATVVYKISEEVPLFGQLLSEMAAEAGLPNGVFNQVYGGGDVGEALARSNIDFLGFTGSSRTGQALYKIAAEKFIPCLLEMGGSSPGVIFADADLDKIMEPLFWAKFVNTGQICCGLKRLFVERSVFDQVVEKLRDFTSGMKIGDPLEDDSVMGPLAAKRQQELLKAQVDDATAKGAKTVTCCDVSSLKGAYYPATLLTGVTPAMRAWSEELFGPVLPVIPFDSEDEAVRLANDTEYGLSAFVFTEDAARFARVAAQLQSGSISQNGLDYSAAGNPFGGYKKSGLGKTGGVMGFQQVTRGKVVTRQK